MACRRRFALAAEIAHCVRKWRVTRKAVGDRPQRLPASTESTTGLSEAQSKTPERCHAHMQSQECANGAPQLATVVIPLYVVSLEIDEDGRIFYDVHVSGG